MFNNRLPNIFPGIVQLGAVLNRNTFEITVDTTNPGSASNTFILPTSGSGYDAQISWGDDINENITGSPGNVSHPYPSPGKYKIKISGIFPSIFFNDGGDKLKLIEINNWGDGAWKKISFFGCSNMVGRYSDFPNTTAVTSTASMFRDCVLFNSQVKFDTSNVTDMSFMFSNCLLFDQPVNFNTSKVTNMSYMFKGCGPFNRELNFDTSNVTTMLYMLYQCSSFNKPVPFNTSKVTNMGLMFFGCLVFDQPINFNISKVTNMSQMLQGASNLSADNYDNMLISFASQSVHENIVFSAGDANYSVGAATNARDYLTSPVVDGGRGWTITDGGQEFDNGKLIITFDDATGTTFTKAYPELVRQGVAATVFVITSFTDVVAGYMTWADIQEMDANGMDMQCHTHNHVHLTTLTESEVIAQYQAVNDAFEAHDLPIPNHVAYPFGDYNDNVKAWTATMRASARTTVIGYTHRSTDKLAIPSRLINNNTDVAVICNYLDLAKKDHLAVGVYTHGIDGGDISSANFTAIIEYAKALGIDIITQKQLYDLMIA